MVEVVAQENKTYGSIIMGKIPSFTWVFIECIYMSEC